MSNSWFSRFAYRFTEIAFFPKILKGFNAKNLQQILNISKKSGTEAELLNRVENCLNNEPNNLAALYLAGALKQRFLQDEKAAFSYIKLGFFEGVKQGLSIDNLLLFYEEAALLNSEIAFNWLTQIEEKWNNREGWKFLLQEAVKRFGQDSTQYRILFLRWELKNLNQINDEFSSIEPAIASFKELLTHNS